MMAASLKANGSRVPMLLLMMGAISTAVVPAADADPATAWTAAAAAAAVLDHHHDDVTDALDEVGTDCPGVSDSLKDFARRIDLFERRVSSNRMISASLVPSAADPSTITDNKLKEKQISEGMKRLRETESKLAKMDADLGQSLRENTELRARVGALAGYVDTVAKKIAPATCHELRQLGLAESGWYPIDPDGPDFGEDPISVFCDMIPAERGMGPRGVTRIGHNLENRAVEVANCKGRGCHKTTIAYKASMDQIRQLINISEQCTQAIQYNCLSAPLTKTKFRSEVHAGSWRGPDGAENVYWDGSHGPDVHVCACESAGNCVDAGYPCNCDSPLPAAAWKTDAGVLANKTALPVVELTFQGLSSDGGEQQQAANFTLGNLECSTAAADADPDPDIRGKRDEVKKMLRQAWRGYAAHAWGSDYVRPASEKGQDSGELRGLGGTIVEALDTLFIAGLEEEFERGVDWVEKELPGKLNKTRWRSVSHVTKGILGGLLSSHALSGDARLLRAAVDVADRLLPAFDSPSGLPYAQVDMLTGSTKESTVSLWHIGALHLEFTYLSALTGDQRYVEKVTKVREVLRVGPRINGLYPTQVSAENGQPVQHPNWRGGVRFYDVLLKTWLFSGRRDSKALEMFSRAIDAVTETALQKSKSGMLYIPRMAADLGNAEFFPDMLHESCFWGGLYALWARELQHRQQQQGQHGAASPPPPPPPAAAPEEAATAAAAAGNGTVTVPPLLSMTDIGQGLASTCRQAYDRTATKLGPWLFRFEAGDASRDAEAGWSPQHFLGHEAVESYLVLWRLTGDDKYRDWGWDVALALEKHCRRDAGYSDISDVNKASAAAGSVDWQPSYFLGATLKYLYLLLSSPNLLPLDQWVFNQAGHPLPVSVSVLAAGGSGTAGT